MEQGSNERMNESGQGSDPTLGAALVAFYIVLLCSARQKTEDHHNRAVVFINYLFFLLYYKNVWFLK